MITKRTTSVIRLGTFALLALLLTVGTSHAQLESNAQGWTINHPAGSSSFPWNSPGYRGYSEPAYAARPISPAAAFGQPEKYQLYINELPMMKNTEDPNAVTLVAHVPSNAQMWIEDRPTTSGGTLRTFQSPPLTPGKRYSYTVRVAWVEDGKLVSQTHEFPIKAGDVQCVYLVQAGSKLEGQKAVVQANLSKLSPEDRKLAEAQQFCAVQNGVRLGAMGTPAKLLVKGQPVFLCCESCRDRAERNPERTLAKVKELKSKTGTPGSP
jgi:uncharacterized protein (TIGR03000 family)